MLWLNGIEPTHQPARMAPPHGRCCELFGHPTRTGGHSDTVQTGIRQPLRLGGPQ